MFCLFFFFFFPFFFIWEISKLYYPSYGLFHCIKPGVYKYFTDSRERERERKRMRYVWRAQIRGFLRTVAKYIYRKAFVSFYAVSAVYSSLNLSNRIWRRNLKDSRVIFHNYTKKILKKLSFHL